MSADILPWDLLAPGRRLFLALLAGDAKARDLLGGRGFDDAAVAAAAEERRRLPLPHRDAMYRALRDYHARIGAPPAALEAVDRLGDPKAVVVVGGQQPAVAGGPLMVFAKAVGILALAERLEKAGAGPVVPVWWVASEDHDAAEAGAVLLAPGREGRALLESDVSRRMLSRRPAPRRLAILQAVGPGAHAEEVARLLPDGGDLGAHAAGVLARLLGPRGLVVVEPQVLRPFARRVFERDVREPGVLAALVRSGNARVRGAGHAPVLADPQGPLHFGVDRDGVRSRGTMDPGALDSLETALSADVALRVLAQDAALPVAAQVCGPTEMEYLAAIHPAREATGVFAPCAVPRPGVTILEKRTEEALAELGSDLAGLYARGEGALLAPGAAPDNPLAAAARRLLADLDGAAGDPAALPSAVRSRLGRARDGLVDLAATADRAAAERLGVGESRRRKVLEALLPGGAPQEREWSLLPFLLRHGPGLWERMVAELSGPAPGHRVIRPESAR